LSPKTLTNSYRSTIESILSGCITAWYGNCTASNHWALQGVVRSAHYLPSRTTTAPNVTAQPKRELRKSTTRATVCSLRYHPEGEVSKGASKLGPKDCKKQLLSQGNHNDKAKTV
jgi:hypothetical protein